MTQQDATEQVAGSNQRRRRTKPYPLKTFEEVLFLPTNILSRGVNGEIERLTLLRELNRSPESSLTRDLITNSSKYGLTSGSYTAQVLTVTEQGQAALGIGCSPAESKYKQFELAIKQFDSFNSVYERLKDGRLPVISVLKDELGRANIYDTDLQKVAEVFTANIRYLGLVTEINDNDYVRRIEQVIGELSSTNEQVAEDAPDDSGETQPIDQDITRPPTPPEVSVRDPSVHIDVQIHIDSSASPEQIDQIFSSMARHLYGREG